MIQRGGRQVGAGQRDRRVQQRGGEEAFGRHPRHQAAVPGRRAESEGEATQKIPEEIGEGREGEKMQGRRRAASGDAATLVRRPAMARLRKHPKRIKAVV